MRDNEEGKPSLQELTNEELQNLAEFYRQGLLKYGLDNVICGHLDTVLQEIKRRSEVIK